MSPAGRPLAVVAAMGSELAPLAARARLRRDRLGPMAVRTGELHGAPVVAAVVGVGTARARAATERLLEAADPRGLVMVGICGGLDPALAVGAVVRPAVVEDGATGERVRPDDPLGSGDGVLRTSDHFEDDPAELERLRAAGVVALDMETAAVAAACRARSVPWAVARAVSDRPADGLVDAAVAALAGAKGRPQPGALAGYVLRRPGSLRTLARLARDSRRASVAAAEAGMTVLEAWPAP